MIVLDPRVRDFVLLLLALNTQNATVWLLVIRLPVVRVMPKDPPQLVRVSCMVHSPPAPLKMIVEFQVEPAKVKVFPVVVALKVRAPV